MVSWKRKQAKEQLNIKEKNGVVWLSFPALEESGLVSHSFSTRIGGVSKGVFSSMNFSFTRGDEPEHVMENYRRMAEILGTAPEKMVLSYQTHTTHVRKVTEEDEGKGIVRPRDYQDVDGLITNVPGIALVTFYADSVSAGSGSPGYWLVSFRMERNGKQNGKENSGCYERELWHQSRGCNCLYWPKHLPGLL